MGLLKAIERLLGRRSHRPTTSVSTAGKRIPEGAAALAIVSRMMTRSPVELEPPGPKFDGVTTDDIDPATGRLYPDYIERRRQRETARKAIGGGRLIGVVGHDVYPD